MKPLHILFDQDGVLAHWGNGFSTHPAIQPFPNIPRHADQRSFNLKEGLTPEEGMAVDEVFNTMSYGDLEPMEGAIEAYRYTVERGHIVHIATSPWWTNKKCLQDKSDWVEKYLGDDARRRMVLTGDKTMLRADYLIDDKPSIKGEYEPVWEQIIFDQPYNQEVVGERLMAWDDWYFMLDELEVRNTAYA